PTTLSVHDAVTISEYALSLHDALPISEQLALEGKIKKVLVHEVSRIARRNSVAHRFVETLEECGVSLYWHAQSIETLLSSGKRKIGRATSELQSPYDLVCRLLLEKKNI